MVGLKRLALVVQTDAWLELRCSMLARQYLALKLSVAVTRRHVAYNALHERWPGNFCEIRGLRE